METYGLTISPSRAKTYLMCPFKYFLENNLQIRGGDSYATLLGQIVHSVLENLAKGFDGDWKELYRKFYFQKKPHLLHKTWEKIESSEHVWFFENQRAIANIEEFRTNKKSAPLYIFWAGIDMVQKVLDRNPNPFSYQLLSAEKKFKVHIGDGIYITGIVDLISKVDDGIIEIRDWKTGGWIPSYDEMIVDPQLLIYDLAGKYLYPDYQTRLLVFDYIQKNEFIFCVEEKERHQNRQWIVDLVKTIDGDNNAFRISNNPEAYYKCKNLCDPQTCMAYYDIRHEVKK